MGAEHVHSSVINNVYQTLQWTYRRDRDKKNISIIIIFFFFGICSRRQMARRALFANRRRAISTSEEGRAALLFETYERSAR